MNELQTGGSVGFSGISPNHKTARNDRPNPGGGWGPGVGAAM